MTPRVENGRIPLSLRTGHRSLAYPWTPASTRRPHRSTGPRTPTARSTPVYRSRAPVPVPVPVPVPAPIPAPVVPTVGRMYRCWFCGSWDAISFANLCPFHIRCAIRCAHKKEGRREHRDGGRRPLGHSRIPLRTAMSRRGTPRLNERKARALPSDQRIAALPTQHTQESYSLAPVSRLFERALDCVARQARLARWKRLGKGPAPQWRRARGSRKADEIGLAPRRLRCLRLIPMSPVSQAAVREFFVCAGLLHR